VSENGEGGKAGPPLRADALRNREDILRAAREVFFESGPSAPLDEIARRSGVSIATLYRLFPGRDALIRHMVLEGYELALREALDARSAADDDPMAGIERFLRRMIDLRSRLVLPLFGGPIIYDAHARALRLDISAVLDDLLATARARHAVRDDVTSTDLIIASALAGRPLPNTPPDWADEVAHRHITVYLDGLRPGGSRRLAGPAPTRQDLETYVNEPEQE
jgi:AcrR family transcriptional regulator